MIVPAASRPVSAVFLAIGIFLLWYFGVPDRGSLNVERGRVVSVMPTGNMWHEATLSTERGARLTCKAREKWHDFARVCPIEAYRTATGQGLLVHHDGKDAYHVTLESGAVLLDYGEFEERTSLGYACFLLLLAMSVFAWRQGAKRG